MIARLHAWFAAHPMAGDAVWAAVIFLPVWIGCTVALNRTMGSWGLLIGLGWTALYCAPLLWRRTHPDLCALALVPAHLIQLAGTDNVLPGNVTALLALYAVAAYGRPRLTRPWLLFGLVAALVGALDWTVVGAIAHGAEPLATDPLGWWMFGSASVAASWFMGMLARSRRSNIQALRDRADALERERDQSRALAATQERSRIAREMHDVVAHSLSVIVVQADGAAFLADADGDAAERLASTRAALATIQSTARTALAETRRLVGVLHAGPGEPGAGDEAERAPAATLADVPALVRPLAEAGRAASLTIEGDPDAHAPLGAGAELAAYRIVQESLTNVLKHAGPGASVRVTLTHTPGGLAVTVADDGAGPGPTDGRGHGLVGMRERVAAFGGTLTTGRRPSGGFEVRATFPTQREDS